MHQTLSGGRLVLIELTRERMNTSMIFEILPGWWAGAEDGRQKGPLMSEEEWGRQLQQVGFSSSTWLRVKCYGLDGSASLLLDIELGARDYTNNTRLEMHKLVRNITFALVDLVSLVIDRPQAVAQVWSKVLDLFRSKKSNGPSPITIYGILKIEKAV